MEHKAGPILSLTSFCLAAIGGRRLLQGGCTPEDKRGKQKSGNDLKPLEIISVMEHISLFPTKKTHYGTREHNYLDAELNVKFLISEDRNLLSYPWAFIFAFRLWADKAQVKENRQNLYINGIHGADIESSGRSVPRNPKEHFNISKYHYFLFSRHSGKGVIVGKDFIEGAITNTFSLPLPGVITTKMQVDLAIPNEKFPISMKKWITSKSLTHLYMVIQKPRTFGKTS
ncbi:hypothetical protein ILUMI_16968 [Ignelater luminosus]|uniref:Uncharacterized protein n=1 Tax=Ignelater luminosus TaxID=2038154 RepID=A0A8K0CKY4_IGNLU|nr:hypothetical protein ILUMI_16968 [Ignelater luminosus]